MKKIFGLEIKEPCTARLDKMEKTSKGMFCQFCTKDVVDFSNKKYFELRKIFYSQTDISICGKFKRDQLVTPSLFNHKISIPLKYIFLVSLLYGKNIFSQTNTNNRLKDKDSIATQNQNKPCTKIVLGMPSRIKDNTNLHVFNIISNFVLYDESKRKYIKDITVYFLGSTNDATFDELNNTFKSEVELEKDFSNIYSVITYNNKSITKIFPFDSNKIINKIYQQNIHLTSDDFKKLGIK